MDIKLILKGFLVGVGKIIPGVSGSMLAYSLGIYENIIDAVTDFFVNPKRNIKLLLNFGLGIFLAIIFFSKLLIYLLNNYYIETMSLFLGLIIGTVIPFSKTLKFNKKNIFIFFITIIIFILITSNYSVKEFIYTGNLLNNVYIGLLGIIDAITSIVPGISGTAIFMMLGSYEFVLKILSNPISIEFIIYGIGLIIGIIFICYVMNYLLKNKKDETNSLIFGLMVSSIFVLFISLSVKINLLTFLLFVLGIIIGYKFDK